jgi:trehalose 6-phosphate synthase/phosphatase
MQRQLAGNTVQDWAHGFVEALQKPVPGTPVRTRTLKAKLRSRLLEDYRQAGKRLLLLDYDGSLVPFSENYKEARPPESLTDLLKRLSADPRNEVILVSGRSVHDLKTWFGKLPIGLIAEHGAAVRKPGNKSWRTIEKVDTRWKQTIRPILEKYVGLAPGARLETKPHSLVWHYRSASPYYAQKYAVVIRRVLKPLIKRWGLEIMQGNKVLEIKNPRVSKGAAVQPWLKRKYGFVLALGDDVTDEELFAVLSDDVYSIKIGHGRTAARFRLNSHRDTLSLLQKMAKS